MGFLHSVHLLLQVADHLVCLSQLFLLLFLRFHLLVEFVENLCVLKMRLLDFPFQLSFLLVQSL